MTTTSVLQSGSLRSYPKTNSLGTAKVDCHTCLRLRRRCDRQRPQCSPCIRERRKCGGYVLDIVWKDQRETDGPLDQTREGEGSSSRHSGQRQFKFVPGNAKRKRKTKTRRLNLDELLDADKTPPDMTQMHGQTHPAAEEILSVNFNNQSPPTSISPDLWSGNEDQYRHATETWVPDPYETVEHSPEVGWSSNSSSPNYRVSQSQFFIGPLEPPQENVEGLWPDERSGETAMIPYNSIASPTWSSSPEYFPLSTGVRYSSPAQQAEAILDMYDQEFCIIPLTADCRSNPFRLRKESCEGSDFLLHAMLAISSQHLAKRDRSALLAAETQNHQAMALRLFSEALGNTSAFKLLDALLLLVNFEATQTASSTWSVHLSGAQKILEGIGVDEACRSPRTRAQIAMLVWWDVTIAFISRKEPRLPLIYLETLMKHDEEDGWTFFTLNGCPAELVMAIARLAKLASIYEKVLTMEWTVFTMTPVERISEEIQKWRNDEDTTADEIGQTEDDPDSKRNKFHCIEAWRHAILLYVYRVFCRKQDSSNLRSISHLARVVLDHVRCIPNTAIVQKQTLLPVFLAGSEVGDEASRTFVREYCNHWSLTVRYDMFATVASLLERIWAGWDVSTRDVYWWGEKVGGDDLSQSDREQGMVSELLLG